jgi:hypothetical protein
MKNKTYRAIAGIFVLATMSSSFAQPSISLQPGDQIVNLSFTATFRTTGSSALPLSYQWFFASNAIAGAITNVLTVTNAHATNAGSYFAVVTDASGSVTSRVATLTVILPATLDPKVGPNIRLGEDSPLLPGLNQGEIHIARSFADPNTIITGFQDGIASIQLGGPACTYGVSADGGLTWHRSFIPGIGVTSEGQNAGGADQVAVVDAQGILYIATLVIPSVASPSDVYASQLVINKSLDGGQSFGSPIVAATGVPSNWPDKDWIAINTFRGAPHANRIALAYDREPTLNGYSQYSDDGGATWSQPRTVADALPFAVDRFNHWMSVDPVTGDVNISFYDTRNDTTGFRYMTDLYLTQSKDGGNSWLSPNLRVSTESSNEHDCAGLFPCPGINYGNQQGDYEGLVSYGGTLYPIWTDSRRQLERIAGCAGGLAMEEVFTAKLKP